MSPTQVELAIFPLNAVLFPGGLLPLRIFEQRYMEMAKTCLRDDKPFGVCLIRSGREVGAPAEPEPVGCTARIIEWDMQQLGVLSVKTLGGQRFRIVESHVTDAGLTHASVEMLPQDCDEDLPEAFEACANVLRAVIREHGAKMMAEPLRFDSSSWVSSRLAELLPVPLVAKQKLLELQDAAQRIEILNKFLLQHRIAG
ncbi:MAG: LON peptidase substrate-binding domain-containing protein [Proteobacteria bacterium]|nr:LON peptidase substrate-binding domain-containing protein [Pseudomonadota bacterium]